MSKPSYGSVGDAAQTTGPQNPLWTAQRVRDELPEVSIRVNHRTYHNWVVKGRQLPFATVMPFEIGSGTTFEFSWQTIADCLNRGVPLRA